MRKRLSCVDEHVRHNSDGTYYLACEYHHDCWLDAYGLLIRPDPMIFNWRMFSSMKVER